MAPCPPGRKYECCDPRPPRGERHPRDHSAVLLQVAIHAPLAGSDRVLLPGRGHDGSVAIHAPLAGSDRAVKWDDHLDLLVAIHAPLAGSDPPEARRPLREERLRSTPPSRGATCRAEPVLLCYELRSTPPSRGATMSGRRGKEGRHHVAIHAPLAGSDSAHDRSHRAGRVAIHAPLAGSDFHFREHRDGDIQLRSTPPSRGATARDQLRNGRFPGVAIHAPLAGSDSPTSTRAKASRCCDPRPPRGERRVVFADDDPATIVAIHAPLAGSDPGRSNVLERRTIESEVREPRGPPSWRSPNQTQPHLMNRASPPSVASARSSPDECESSRFAQAKLFT